MNTNLDTFNEASLFVIPVELTNRIDRIMVLTEFHIEGRDFSMLVHVDSSCGFVNGDILIDENERTYKVVGCEMIRRIPGQNPDLYQVICLLLEGDPQAIGEYLAFYQRSPKEGELRSGLYRSCLFYHTKSGYSTSIHQQSANHQASISIHPSLISPSKANRHSAKTE